MQPAFHDVIQDRYAAHFVGVVTHDAEAVALEEGTRGDGDLSVESDQVGLARLLEDSIHDRRHVPLASMSGGHVRAVDVAVRIELDEARDFVIHNGNPWLLALASLAPFLGPGSVALDGRRPGVALLLAIVVARQLMYSVVVDLADSEFIPELVFPNHGVRACIHFRENVRGMPVLGSRRDLP